MVRIPMLIFPFLALAQSKSLRTMDSLVFVTLHLLITAVAVQMKIVVQNGKIMTHIKKDSHVHKREAPNQNEKIQLIQTRIAEHTQALEQIYNKVQKYEKIVTELIKHYKQDGGNTLKVSVKNIKQSEAKYNRVEEKPTRRVNKVTEKPEEGFFDKFRRNMSNYGLLFKDLVEKEIKDPQDNPIVVEDDINK